MVSACRGRIRSVRHSGRRRQSAGRGRTRHRRNRLAAALGWAGEDDACVRRAPGADRRWATVVGDRCDVGGGRSSCGRSTALGMCCGRCGSDPCRAEQRKRRDQRACQGVHAPTLSAEQCHRDNDFANVDNEPACGYRVLHPRSGRSLRRGDFGPGPAPRRLNKRFVLSSHCVCTARTDFARHPCSSIRSSLAMQTVREGMSARVLQRMNREIVGWSRILRIGSGGFGGARAVDRRSTATTGNEREIRRLCLS